MWGWLLARRPVPTLIDPQKNGGLASIQRRATPGDQPSRVRPGTRSKAESKERIRAIP